MLQRRRLEGADNGGSDGDDPAPSPSSLVDRTGCALRDGVALRYRQASIESLRPGRREARSVGDRDDSDTAPPEREKKAEGQRTAGRGRLDGPRPGCEMALDMKERERLRNVRVLDRLSPRKERTP